MAAFAYYRLPYLHHATFVAQHEGEPEVLSSVAELNGKEGFVIAPFSPSSDCPVLLIHPDETRLLAIEAKESSDKIHQADGQNAPKNQAQDIALDKLDSEHLAYSQDFSIFHDQLDKAMFRKIVLARKSVMYTSMQAETLFMRACRLYPRLFVALVYTPQSGMWLMATPEILLKGDGKDFTTMSLAGTQRAQPSITIADYPVDGVTWSEKNREEQQYVTDYIKQCVATFTDEFTINGPYTTTAANLYHLRTDITFRLPDVLHLGDVLEKLYPTPAVCGIPKAETREFILSHERQSRKYYSGFVGPLSLSGKTHLFVSLRCMNIMQDGKKDCQLAENTSLSTCELYAGGGLLKESEMEREWMETEAKLQTIKKVLA